MSKTSTIPVYALFLLAIALIPGVLLAGSQTFSQPYPFSTTYSNQYYSPLTEQGVVSTSSISQVSYARLYNNDTAAWLLTCPTTPGPVGQNSPQYIDSGAVPFMAGDVCLAPPTPALASTITPTLTVSWSTTSLATASLSVVASNLAYTSLINNGYSPMVDGQISNGYSTRSNIFDSVPSTNQQGIWTWYSKYADFGNFGGASNTYSVPGLTYQRTMSPPQGSTTSYTCTYPYTATATYSISNVQNLQMPFQYASGNVNTYIMPFFLYDYNLTAPSLPRSLYINQTYDVFGPLTYNTPTNSINPFPINTSSYFFSNYNGALTPFYLGTSQTQYGLLSVNTADQGAIINSQSQSSFSSAPSSGGAVCPNQAYTIGDFQTQLKTSQAIACAEQAGFTGDSLYTAVAIASAESGLHPGEYAPNGNPPAPAGTDVYTGCANGDKTCYTWDRGIAQINSYYHNEVSDACAYNPTCAFQQLYRISNQGHDFLPWCTYDPNCNPSSTGNGAYCAYMPKTYSGPYCSQGGGETIGGAVQVTNAYFSVNAISMAASPNDYIYVLANSMTAGTSAGTGTASGGPVSIPFGPSVYSSFASCFHDPTTFPYPSGNNACASIGGLGGDMGNLYNSESPTPVYSMFSGTVTWENEGSCNYGIRAYLTLPNGWVIAYGNLNKIAQNILSQDVGHTTRFGITCPGPSQGINGRPATGSANTVISTNPIQVQAGDIIGYTGSTVDLQLLAPLGSVSNTNTKQINMYPDTYAAKTYSAVDPRAMLMGVFTLLGGQSLSSTSSCYIWNFEFGSTEAQDHGLQMTTPTCPTAYALGGGGSSSGYYLEVLRLIPKGFYNTTNIPPSTVPSSQQSSSAWQTSWDAYWSQVLNLQSGSVYVVKQIPINTGGIPGLQNSVTSGGMTYNNIRNNGFIPTNITVDNFGNVYVTGNFKITTYNYVNVPTSRYASQTQKELEKGYSYYMPGIVVVSNTISTPSLYGSYVGITPKFIKDMYTVFDNPISPENPNPPNFDEIAVSPTGASIYLASPQRGNVSVFNGQGLSFLGNISLQYGSTSLGTTSASTSLIGSLNSGPSSITLNVSQYLMNGGVYGVGTKSGTVISQGLANIFSSQYSPSSSTQYDVASYHHPLAISDINGYLYVLDDWNDINNPIGSGTYCKEYGHVSCLNQVTYSGVDFQILNLRVFNDTGGEVQTNPTKFNALYASQSNPLGGSQTYAPYVSNSLVFPPYGWIISANISSAAGGSPYVNFCGSSDRCTYSYSNLKNRGDTYLPAGPVLINSGQTGGQSVESALTSTPMIDGVGFAMDTNNYVSILFPDPSTSPGTANLQNELLLSRFSVENYTSYSTTAPKLRCYSSDSGLSGTNGPCAQDSNLVKLTEPISAVINPFQVMESEGSFKSVPLQGILSTTVGLNGQTSSETTSQVDQQTKCTYKTQSGQYAGFCVSGFTTGNLNTALSHVPTTSTGAAFASTTLASFLEGEVIVPYTYEYQTKVSYAIGLPIISSNPPQGASCPTLTESPSVNHQIVYTYGIEPAHQSTQFTANVESGASYLQDIIKGSYYVPDLSNSNTIIPNALQENIQTNRIFGSILLNDTLGSQTNQQVILAAEKLLDYQLISFTQGKCANGPCPAYQSIYSVSTPQSDLPQDVPSGIANGAHIVSPSPVSQTYTAGSLISMVALFDWYKAQVYSNLLGMTVKSENYLYQGQQHSLQGYQRLIYILNDKFNNTIYVPIDADVARVTKIALSVTPQVSSTNANQTMLHITGVAGFTQLGGQFIPLSNNVIYLYYDTNINYVDANGNPFGGLGSASDSLNLGTIGNLQTALKDQILCAFSSQGGISNCMQADPNSQNPLENAVAQQVTFAPSFNGLSQTCSPPPNSLLAPMSLSCNIYGNDGNAQHKQLPQTCPISSAGNTQYCEPLYANGTGICTSEIGLMAMPKTDSNGAFSFNTPVCGYGTASIMASFYGYPANEPITVIQNPLSYANKTVPYSQGSFLALNYTATPNATIASTQIGELLLSFGRVDVLYAVAVIVLVISIMAVRSRIRRGHAPSTKTTNKRSRSASAI